MIKINVIVKDKTWLKFIKNPENYLKKKIKIIQGDNFFKKRKYRLSVLLSGTKDIKYFNKKFRKKNKSTDILSFPFQSKKELNSILKKEKEIYLGDIIINFNKVENKNLKSFKLEFDRLWIHGLVHLFGYEHKREKDFLKMNQKEKKYLKLINA